MKYKRTILWGISDPHAWYRLGLLNPETQITDPTTSNKSGVTLNSWQQFLWEVYQHGKEEVSKLAGKDPIHAWSVGDVTHGNKHISEQISTQVSAQIEAAYYNFLPMLQIRNLKTFRLAVGTAGHVFGEGSSDILVTNMVRVNFPKLDVRVVYHGQMCVEGVRVDYAHHGPGVGGSPWTKGNSLRTYLRKMLMDDVARNRPTSDLVLRGHYHEYVREWTSYQDHSTWGIIMPPMCFPGDYAQQAMKSLIYVSPGTVAIEIINGRVHDIYPFTKTFDMRDIE